MNNINILIRFFDKNSIIEISRGDEVLLFKTNMEEINYRTYVDNELSLLFGNDDEIIIVKDKSVVKDLIWKKMKEKYFTDLEKVSVICGGHLYMISNISI